MTPFYLHHLKQDFTLDHTVPGHCSQILSYGTAQIHLHPPTFNSSKHLFNATNVPGNSGRVENTKAWNTQSCAQEDPNLEIERQTYNPGWVYSTLLVVAIMVVVNDHN